MSDNFNTSHVTVYREQKYEEEQDAIFQYISCYCLSVLLIIWLSNCIISIHLMLLFIRRWTTWTMNRKIISIHLMLLFIDGDQRDESKGQAFQYISCYCLSQAVQLLMQLQDGFQYISCYCLSIYSRVT